MRSTSAYAIESRCCLILAAVTILLTGFSAAHAATYYMPDNFTSLQAAFAGMSGGDTLIIRSGTYTGSNNAITDSNRPPRGSAGSYTVVRAENDGGVIFNGQNTRDMFIVNTGTGSYVNHYWRFEGIEWKNTPGSNLTLLEGAYVKFFRCGFSQDNADGGGANVYLRRSQYILFEECYAYGGKRYKFQIASGSDTMPTRYNILRRCVARLDNVHASDYVAGIVFYSSHYNDAQNCIVIDSDQSNDWTGTGFTGAFSVPSTLGPSTGHNFIGCIGLNNHLGGFFTASNDRTTATASNCIIWNSRTDVIRPNWLRGAGAGSTKSVTNCTFGVSSGDGTPGLYADGNETSILKNNIITQFTTSQAIGGWTTQNFNAYYGNTSNNNSGPNDITNVNPRTSSLRYLPRIEAGSPLKGAGESGVDIGANVMKRVGVSGSLYGETGYNIMTNEDLWPFPSENLIRSKMRAYSYNVNGVSISGARGFCADNQTLTKYIWEYLGNPIPSEIYDGGSQGVDTTPPASPSGVIIQIQ